MNVADKLAWAIVDYDRARGIDRGYLSPVSEALLNVRAMLRRGASPRWAIGQAFDGDLRDHLLSIVGSEEA